MSVARQEIETRNNRGVSPESFLWTHLTPFRLCATRLGFDFLKRECSSPEGITRRTNLFVHPTGTWLDLIASVDRSMNLGPVVAAFRSWAVEDGNLIEVATFAGTPVTGSRFSHRFLGFVERVLGAGTEMHPLHSSADLAVTFALHRSVLDSRGLTPLAAGDDPLDARDQWEQTIHGNVWLIAPP